MNDRVRKIIERGVTLCRAVASHELANVPVYIVPQSTLPAELGRSSVCDGFTSPSLDLYVREFIPDYRGRGPCMVINDLTLCEQTDPADFEQAMLAVIIHELAHVLERPMLYRMRDETSDVVLAREAAAVVDVISSDPSDHELAVPFLGHEVRFIRVALHLRYRAATAGTDLPEATLCAGRDYGLSHACRYREALSDEPARLAEQSISAVLARPPPLAFTRLWESDRDLWFSEPIPVTRKECA